MRYLRYPRDPYWMSARYAGSCACGKQILKGDQILYFPNNHKAECQECGNKSWAILEDEKALEVR